MTVATVSGFIIWSLRPARRNAGRSNPGEALSTQPRMGERHTVGGPEAIYYALVLFVP